MGNIPPETTEKKVPSKGFAIASLACGIISLAGGGTIFVLMIRAPQWWGFSLYNWAAIVFFSDSSLILILPFLAIVFGAIPLKQGKGTDWDGKRMAKKGLVMGIISLIWTFLFFGTVVDIWLRGFS
jgi:hypothetical protein